MKKPALVLTLGLGAACIASLASAAGDGIVPLPFARPDAPTSVPMPIQPPHNSTGQSAAPVPAAMPVPDITGSIPRIDRPLASTALKSGLDALSGNDAAEALAVRNQLPVGSIDRRILTWAIANSGLRDVPYREIAAAQQELTGWPGLGGLREKEERALYRENPPAAAVLSALGPYKPQTPEGAIILARAQVASGRAADAAKTIRGLWTSEALDVSTEDKVMAEFGSLLGASDHKSRMDYLMYRSRTAQAKRFSGLGNAQSLYKAWTAVAGGARNASALIDAVDKSWASDPAYLFIRIEYARRLDKYEEAAKLLEKVPRDPAKLINSNEWWNERRIIARGLADQGDFKAAYRLVAAHVAQTAVDKADAEFHAGWYALRALHDPTAAETHFRKIQEASSRPLSASRALYWLGRSAEAGGPGQARSFYESAARYSGTFYGQLAAAKLGKSTLDVSYPSPSAADRQRFENRDVVRAIARLDAVGHDRRAAALYSALAEQIDSPGELALLTSRAEARGDHALSLKIGKAAFSRGVDVAALAYPIGVIPAAANIAGSGKALAYSIARQESAFNPAAVSPANARGLLQLLPGTAQGVAKRHGMSFKADRLTSDAGYNATLGAHYLGEQIDTFGGSYVLTFIAYNAGPKRVPEWIARYGDPRGKSLDEVIDWVERIPFPETRNYVQRVLENYQVYKTRLGQKADIVSDLRYGRQ
ncbi:soluble lytic murein transglycosylase [Rhizobium sp. NFR07]|uniref:lytic transglycosylase domain-containing protein n=1 Tax=Rhizobium sp. NFR07 TaxID=1566262 RepID=UPI0008F277BB|nr:lytic transglycosylase domain-containing protein [Rhizobium sp. NFR07]SFB58582.1 soluble lytic murein transglycosylase [Rhizobium sp. NFR07]